MFSWFKREAQPFDAGYLPEEGGHRVYYHRYGNPKGPMLLVFHGGPGSFSKPKHAAAYDLKRFQVVLFDQRGAGQSQPAGELANNTTTDLLNDAARLVAKFAKGPVVAAGSSWGSTLALLFAQAHPEKVRALILKSVFLCRAKDVAWITEGAGRLYPEIVEKVAAEVPVGQTIRGHYAQLLQQGEVEKAAALYGHYEHQLSSLTPALPEGPPTPDHVQAFRLYMHYDAMNYGLSENQILANIGRIAHLPALIVHNRADLVCPCDQAWLVHKALPQSRLVLVPDFGHSSAQLNDVFKREAAAFLAELVLKGVVA